MAGDGNDENLGAIYKVNSDGSGLQKITSTKGIYRTPAMNSDGSLIAFRKEGGNGDQGFDFTKKTGLYLMDSNGGNLKLLAQSGEFPMFTKDGKRIFFQTGGTFFGSLTKRLKSVDLTGNNERTHFTSKLANRLLPSPNNEWVAMVHLHKVYVAPFVVNGKALNLDANTKNIKVESLSDKAGINIHWSGSNDKVHWTLGEKYFTKSISNNMTDPFSKTNLQMGKTMLLNRVLGQFEQKKHYIISLDFGQLADRTVISDYNKFLKSLCLSAYVFL